MEDIRIRVFTGERPDPNAFCGSHETVCGCVGKLTIEDAKLKSALSDAARYKRLGTHQAINVVRREEIVLELDHERRPGIGTKHRASRKSSSFGRRVQFDVAGYGLPAILVPISYQFALGQTGY